MNWDELMDRETAWAIEQKRRAGERDFKMRVKIIGPDDQIADTPLLWRNEDEKRAAMLALSYTCGLVGAQAGVIISDSRWCDSNNFCDYFKLPKPTPETIQEFNREYLRVLQGQYGGLMENLPREVWREALLIAVKGPKVERLRTVRYHFQEGALVFEPEPVDIEGKDHVLMLPAWWH